MVSYSPSLPLPLPPQLPVLPSSLTQPPARPLDLPSNLPRPLLPLSPRSASRSESLAQNHNPFLWGGSAGEDSDPPSHGHLSGAWGASCGARSVLDVHCTCLWRHLSCYITWTLEEKQTLPHVHTQTHCTGNEHIHTSQPSLPLEVLDEATQKWTHVLTASLPHRQKHEWLPAHSTLDNNWLCWAADISLNAFFLMTHIISWAELAQLKTDCTLSDLRVCR